LAVDLAEDRQMLASYRPRLRNIVARSPVGDHATYTMAVESAYRTMWRRWCRGE
jgi:predicted O-linked N-acetylglucosamine transferase (SPINDLY family)